MCNLYNANLRALKILAGTSVDLDLGADVNEERNLDNSAGLERSGLGGAGRGVALEARLGVGDLEHDEHRGLDSEDVALVGDDLAHFVLFDELEAVAELVSVDRELLKGLHVHEIIEIAIIVEILHLLALNDRVLEFIGWVEGALSDRARDDILELGADESGALARLYVLELDDLKNLSVHVESDTVFEISGYYHNK